MSAPHRIVFLHTAQGDRLTGAPRMVYQLVSRLDRSRFLPTYVTPGPTELSGRLEAEGVDVRTVTLPDGLDVYGQALTKPGPLRALSAVRGLLEYNRRLTRLFRDVRPELVWVSNLRTFLSVFPAAGRCGVPLVWNIWLGQPSRGLVRFMNEFALRRARRVVTEYRAQADEVFTADQRERMAGKLRTVYTGHPVPDRPARSPRPAPEAPMRVGVLAAFSPRKNQRLFLEAAKLVRETSPHVQFLLGGEAATEADRGYEEEIRAFAARENLNVEWCGWVDPPETFLDRLDVYVQSSEHEGLPGAVREAMLNGLPVVATKVGGTAEIVEEGETGFLVEKGDARALADAILRLDVDPERALRMGSAGRRRAEELFSREAFLSHYQDVLDEALSA